MKEVKLPRKIGAAMRRLVASALVSLFLGLVSMPAVAALCCSPALQFPAGARPLTGPWLAPPLRLRI